MPAIQVSWGARGTEPGSRPAVRPQAGVLPAHPGLGRQVRWAHRRRRSVRW